MEEFLKYTWETIKSLPGLIENLVDYIINSLNFLPNELRIPFATIILLIFAIFIYRLIK